MILILSTRGLNRGLTSEKHPEISPKLQKAADSRNEQIITNSNLRHKHNNSLHRERAIYAYQGQLDLELEEIVRLGGTPKIRPEESGMRYRTSSETELERPKYGNSAKIACRENQNALSVQIGTSSLS